MCSYVFKKGLGWSGRSVSIQPFSRNLVRVSATKRLPELALWPPPAPGQGSRQTLLGHGGSGRPPSCGAAAPWPWGRGGEEEEEEEAELGK